MGLKPGVIFLIDQISYLKVRQVYSKIHIPEEALVIVKALLLSLTNAKVVVSVRENLTNVFHSHFTSILPRLKMAVDKGKGGVFKVEPDSDRAFVSCHACEPSLDLELSNEAYFLSMLFFSKHDDIAANHDFLNDWDILHSLWVPI